MEIHTSPANPLVYGGRLTLKVSVNDAKSITLPIVSGDYRGGDHTCPEWAQAVLNQEHTCGITIHLTEGYHQIRIYGQEPGAVLERLVIYNTKKQRKPSYFGPEKTYRKE